MEMPETDLLASYGGWIIGMILALFAGRYLALAGLFYLIFYKIGARQFSQFKIQPRPPKPGQLKTELKYSFSTIVVFSCVGWIIWWLYCMGMTTIYLSIPEKGWFYFFASLIVMIVVHDAYFYWTHRLLHHRWFFRKVHRVHHLSVNPTPWSSYSFHPFEALIESLVVFLFTMIFPVHIFALGAFLLIVLLMNVVGHLGFELIPSRYRAGLYGRIFNSSTHHNLHHQKTKTNFGYYFSFWDRKMKTLDGSPNGQTPSPRSNGQTHNT
jgi:sterol desaturase/sphingolipid hydroxylase (fatty acid hydroxylase superfamily)